MCVFTQYIAFVFSEVQSAFCSIYIKACLVMSATIKTLVCKHKCTSNVWSYFEFVSKSDNGNRPKDPNKAICNIPFKKQVCCQSQSILPIAIHQTSFLIFVYTIRKCNYSYGNGQTKCNNIAR